MRTRTYKSDGGQSRTTVSWGEPRKSKLEIAYELQKKREADLYQAGSIASYIQHKAQRREDEKAKIAHERAMELAKLNQAGGLARAGINQEGNLAVANRQQLGQTKRKGMDIGLGRDKLGLDRDKQDFDQTMDLKKYSRDGSQWDKKFAANQEQNQYLRGVADKTLAETQRTNRFNEYNSFANNTNDMGMSTPVSREMFQNRASQFNAYASPNFSSGSGFSKEEQDWLNANPRQAIAPQNTPLPVVNNVQTSNVAPKVATGNTTVANYNTPRGRMGGNGPAPIVNWKEAGRRIGQNMEYNRNQHYGPGPQFVKKKKVKTPLYTPGIMQR